MNVQAKMDFIYQFEALTASQIDLLWHKCLQGDKAAYDNLKHHYMKNLLKIKPLYTQLNEETFYNYIENSVLKALDRGIKFKVDDYDSYMIMASNTYFKYFVRPETNTLKIPTQLIKAYSKLDEVYQHIPSLSHIDEKRQINLLSKGFEYPIFLTRLLYYSFHKWKSDSIRQVDIDLTVHLLPAPQRIEWEVFYEKDIEAIKKTIIENLEE